MQRFTDNKDRTWQVALTTWGLRQVRDSTEILLTTLVEENGKLLAELHRDPILLADILWILVEDQAKEQGISVRDFAEALDGDVLGAARTALIEATVDFFDDPETRVGIREVLRQTTNIAEKVRAGAIKQVSELDPDLLATSILDSASSLQESVA